MLDEMIQQNISKFAIFLEYENPCSFFIFYFDIDHGIHQGENKVAQNEKKLCGFSYSKNMANFEVFRQTISSNICLLFLKSAIMSLFIQCTIGGVDCLAVRISYTGELGWELYMPRDLMKPVYQTLMNNGGYIVQYY